MQAAHHQALSKAKIQLMARPDSAFFTTVCFSLRHNWDERIPTACTDGKEILFNPVFFMSLDVLEQIFLLLHESMHVAYMHMGRLLDKDMARWNVACDYVINLQLVDRGFKMPKCGLLDQQYRGMSAEQVYALLPEQCDAPELGLDLKPFKGTPEQLEQEVQDILVRAKIQSKMAGDKPGTIPGDIELFLEKLLNPKLTWQQLLRKWFQIAFGKTDYSFKKPNRRFFPRYYMPTMIGEKIIEFAVAVDISGSVSDHEFTVFVSEVASMLKMLRPERITILQFDTEIQHVDTVRSVNELLKIKFTGRGGTMIKPVLEWANTHKPKLLLVFSDGGFRFYDLVTRTETVWVIHNDPKFVAPFGKVIHYSI